MENSNAYKCAQCGCSLTEVYYANYYSSQYDECNMLCGEGDCWAEWMQDNTQEYIIGED